MSKGIAACSTVCLMGLYGMIDSIVVMVTREGIVSPSKLMPGRFAMSATFNLLCTKQTLAQSNTQHTIDFSFFPSRDVLWTICYSSNVISTWTTDKVLLSNPIPDCNILRFLGMPRVDSTHVAMVCLTKSTHILICLFNRGESNR